MNNGDGVTSPDSNSKYGLNIQSAYVRDTIEINRGLQLIAGARFDRFDMSALDMNTNINRNRVDNLVSPQAAVIIKPIDNVSVYTAYSISYLPASGDQFSALTDGTLDLAAAEIREHRDRREVEHQSETAVPDGGLQSEPHQPADRRTETILGFFFPSGSTLMRGFEASLVGYVTNEWQSSLAYAYTDANDHQCDVGDRRSRQSRSARAVQSIRLVEQISVHADVERRCSASSTSAIPLRRPTIPSECRASFASMPAVYAKIDETWSAQLNVENIFNKGYWASADGNNNISPGQGRTSAAVGEGEVLKRAAARSGI